MSLIEHAIAANRKNAKNHDPYDAADEYQG